MRELRDKLTQEIDKTTKSLCETQICVVLEMNLVVYMSGGDPRLPAVLLLFANANHPQGCLSLRQTPRNMNLLLFVPPP